MAVAAVIWLYRLRKTLRDGNLASVCYSAVLPVGLLWVAILLIIPRSAPLWLVNGMVWGPVLVGCALLVAGAIVNQRDRRADARRRAAWGLEPRRRMLSQVQLGTAWAIGGYLGVIAALLAAVLVMIAAGVQSPDSYRTLGGIVGVALFIVVGLTGWIHTALRPGKIAREDERLRRLDLGLADDQ